MTTGSIKQGDGAPLAVALFNPKTPRNVAETLRAASCFDVPQVIFSGNRVSLEGGKGARRLPREERMKGYKSVDLIQCDYFFDMFGDDVVPVAVEVSGRSESLPWFDHPEKAVYVFGPEDGSLERAQLMQCQRFVTIPARHCMNLSAAVYTVLYDRHMKRVLAELEQPLTLNEHRGWEDPEHITEMVGLS